MRILITGGAGFVGSNTALFMRDVYPEAHIIAFDNLRRGGSEKNVALLKNQGVDFVHGDVRQRADFEEIERFDVLIGCSAEPSVLAGKGADTRYLLDTNVNGLINSLELCRWNQATCILMSTSRVYSYHDLRGLNLDESDDCFRLSDAQEQHGVSEYGINENFSVEGPKSLYGASKYAAEQLLTEYADAFDVVPIINRCSIIAGPGQFGRADQGVVTYWVKAHLAEKELRYIGFGGRGQQVRDVLHIRDLCKLLAKQISSPDVFAKQTFNVGGGIENAVSLRQLTRLCVEETGKSVDISQDANTRYADIPYYVSDCRKIQKICDWYPEYGVHAIVRETCKWMREDENGYFFSR